MAENTDLWQIERELTEQGMGTICGCDEAGAGPLAGPVYAAAVILPPYCRIEGLNDSKKLTEKKRETLYEAITQKAVCWAVARVDAAEIDATDILSARMKAMQQAMDALTIQPEIALIDGNRDKGRSAAITTPHKLVVGGDGKSASIAAASILAKVSRDRYMEKMEEVYPGYGFAKHKGYGTKEHRQAIVEKGPCPIHRESFLGKILSGGKK